MTETVSEPVSPAASAATAKPAAKPSRRPPMLDALIAAHAVFRDYQPLAIGIHKVLLERQPDLDKAQVKSALRAHTASTRYLKALVEGAVRLDLDGQPAGAVSAEQAEQAAGTLRERFKKVAERKKVEREAQREAEKAERAAAQRQEKLNALASKFNTR